MSAFPSFSEFFTACTDHAPYPWQQRLWEHLRDDGWPDAVDIPTGLGKTASLLAGVYEVARQTHEGVARTVPQRILHLVDRKVVVDQTADALEEAARRISVGRDELAPVRAALSRLAGPWSDQPLVVARIHGEAPDLHTWMRSTGVVILTMTPHQGLSRLLFRGLGVSERTRTLHAGLLGVDAAFVVDEPHLAHQAVETLRASLALQSGAPLGLPSASLTLLGASTPPELAVGDRVIRMDESDHVDPAARLRLDAARPVERVECSMKDGPVVKALLRLAGRVRETSDERRLGIIVNSVALAQRVFEALPEPPEHKALVTSRFRPLDREAALLDRRTVVATQTLEVGVDVSFDTLLTEEAPWPALQQRLGRLNRAGGSAAPSAHVVVGPGESAPRPATAAVYGAEAVLATRAHLRDRERDGVVDLSLRAQQAAGGVVPASAWPAPPRTATFHSGFLGTMTTTFPTPASDVPVDAFIAGPERRQSLDVLVCWREDPSLVDDVPPLPGEQVAVPLPALQAFLAGGRAVDVADVEAPEATGRVAAAPRTLRGRVRVLRHGQVLDGVAVARLQPGDEVVLGVEWGGYRRDLGWAPASADPVDDVHLAAFLQAPAGRRAVAVLSSGPLSAWAERSGQGQEPAVTEMLALLEDSEQVLEALGERLPELLLRLGMDGIPALLDRPAGRGIHEQGPVVVLQRRPPTRSSSGGRTVPLQTHQVQVQETAASAAESAGLASELRDLVAVAARWHDEGKAHASFQAYLGNPTPDQPWAKSRTQSGSRAVDRRQALSVGHPLGWRHEGLSAELCRDAGLDEVAVHLVASHHGRARPLLLSPADGPGQREDPQRPSTFRRLNERLGPWGLAYLECLVRLSDWLASERPRTGQADDGASLAAAPARQVTIPTAPTLPEEVPLFGLGPSPMTGWYALAGLLRVVRDEHAEARVHWSGTTESVGVPVWSGEVRLEEAAALVMADPQWALLEQIEAILGKDGLHAKSQKVADVRDVRPALVEAEQLGAWSVLSLLQDWRPSGDGKAELTLPAFHNNSTYVGRALEARRAAPSGAALMAALTDPLEGWAKGGSSGGLDHPHGDVGITGWEGMQDQRPTRPALAPAALLGMTSLGSAGAQGVGPDSRGRQVVLPLPQEPVGWDGIAALVRSTDRVRGWVLEGAAVKTSQYATAWLTRAARRGANRRRTAPE